MVMTVLAFTGECTGGVEQDIELETSAEVTVLCKTIASRADEAQARLRALHPYEVPEILQIPVSAGWPDYLAWVEAQCGPRQ